MRHKNTSTATKRKAGQDDSKAYKRPLYSVHSDSNGVEKQYTWVQSRYFYCHFYEQLVQNNDDLKMLRKKLKDGINIQITGFDGWNVTRPLDEYYESTERPFGHELVLYTLLTVLDPKQYPWNVYYMKHKDLYPEELLPACYKETKDRDIADEELT